MNIVTRWERNQIRKHFRRTVKRHSMQVGCIMFGQTLHRLHWITEAQQQGLAVKLCGHYSELYP